MSTVTESAGPPTNHSRTSKVTPGKPRFALSPRSDTDGPTRTTTPSKANVRDAAALGEYASAHDVSALLDESVPRSLTADDAV